MNLRDRLRAALTPYMVTGMDRFEDAVDACVQAVVDDHDEQMVKCGLIRTEPSERHWLDTRYMRPMPSLTHLMPPLPGDPPRMDEGRVGRWGK